MEINEEDLDFYKQELKDIKLKLFQNLAFTKFQVTNDDNEQEPDFTLMTQELLKEELEHLFSLC